MSCDKYWDAYCSQAWMMWPDNYKTHARYDLNNTLELMGQPWMYPKKEEPKMKRFWMIFDATASSIFTHRYQSCAEAQTEAKRMAVISPGKQYVVMQAIYNVELPKPEPTITVL